jgi:SNF2 family DNA or RNA helicase
MKQIVFVYHLKKSILFNQFTVCLEEREKKGNVWADTGITRVYFTSDLAKLNDTFADPQLVRDALASEIGIRKNEGAFFSGNVELTVLRISPPNLRKFITGATRKKVLCDKEGRLINFEFHDRIKPDIYIEDATINLHIDTINYLNRDYTIDYGSVIVFSQTKIFLLSNSIRTLLKEIPFGKKLSPKEYENARKLLSGYSDFIKIHFSDLHNEILSGFQPVFNLDPSLKFANLYFRYGTKLILHSTSQQSFVDMKSGTEIKRDIEKEEIFLSLLKTMGLQRPSSRGDFFVSAVGRIQKLKLMRDRGFVLTVDHKKLNLNPRLKIDINCRNEKIVVDGKAYCGNASIKISDVLHAFKRNKKCFGFGGNRAGLVSPLMDELQYLSKYYKNNRIVLQKNEFSALSNHIRNKEYYQSDDAFKALMDFEAAHDVILTSKAPASVEKILRPYQKRGYQWLCAQKKLGFGGILADDMGLGKSLQVLAFLLKFKKNRTRTLLVVPKTLIFNWEDEIDKFAPSLRYYICKEGKIRDDITKYDLVITTYGLARISIDNYTDIVWDHLVLDEAQFIKNPYADTSCKIKKIQAKNRIAITGTPLENSLLDLFSIFDYLMPGFLGSVNTFKRNFQKNNPKDLSQLKNLVQPYILRRLKRQVCSELPPKIEIPLYCQLNEEQDRIYKETLSVEKQNLMDIQGENLSINILTVLLRLRQIACNLQLISKEYGESSGKLDSILEIAEEIILEGNSILVFSQFTTHLDIVKKAFIKKSINYYYLDGSTKNRKKVVTSFQKESKPTVFLISLKTGGVGLNLTKANYVFLLDPWWNPAVENQAIDRCHRIGQSNPVTVYRFITKDTIEEKIMLLKNIKKEVEKSVIQVSHLDHIPLSETELKQLIFTH